jgi:hypothetical protein
MEYILINPYLTSNIAQTSISIIRILLIFVQMEKN